MPSRKVSMRASMANQTSHLGIMGGLAKGRTAGASGNRATNKLVIPRGAAKGLAYMQSHGILSRNPQTGGAGKVVKSKPCSCKGLGKTAVEGDLGGDLGEGEGCSPGSYSVLVPGTPCFPCIANYYCPGGPTAFASSLVACPTGTTSLPGGAAIEFCTNCPAGQSSAAGGDCSACPLDSTAPAVPPGPCTCNTGFEMSGNVCVAAPCPPGKGGAGCSDCTIGTYSGVKSTAACKSCDGITGVGVGGGEFRYKTLGATLCISGGLCANANTGILGPPVGSTAQGYFCCASGNDGLYDLSGTPDCSGIGDGSGNSNLCRLSGAGGCSRPSCNAALGCSSMCSDGGVCPWHPGTGEPCTTPGDGCVGGYCPATSCYMRGQCELNPNPNIPSPAMLG